MANVTAFVPLVLGTILGAACGSDAQRVKGGAGTASVAGTTEVARGGAGGLASAAGGVVGNGVAGSSTLVVAVDLQRLAKAFCATSQACCAELSAQPAARCESGLLDNPPLKWVSEGTNALDHSKLNGCISALEAAKAGCAARPIYAACRGLIPASKRIGEVCLLNHQGYQCGADGDNGVCDQVDDDTGICVEVKHTALGQPCEFDCLQASGCPAVFDSRDGDKTAGCFESDGLRCSANFPSFCATPLAHGAACEVTNQCPFGDICLTDEGQSTGTTCQAPLELGAACFGTCGAFTCKGRVCVEPSFGEPSADTSCLGAFPTFRAVF